MAKLLLISGDPDTSKEITSVLPKGFSLEEISAAKDILHACRQIEDSQAGKAFLVDLARWPDFARQFEPFRKGGVVWIALLGSAEGREAALRAGFDDFLLRPVSSVEMALRLGRLTSGGDGTPERERQAAVGRLTSHFCHEVNNSIQTMRGSIDLALEEPGLPAEVSEYLAMCRAETLNISRKIDRLRQIYRPKSAAPQPVALGPLLRQTLNMATDDLLSADVLVREVIDPQLPAVSGSEDQLCLSFLLIIFFLCEEFARRGSGELLVQAKGKAGFAQIAFTATPGVQPPVRAADAKAGQRAGFEPRILPPGLEPARDLIQAQRGALHLFGAGRELSVQVQLSAAGR